MSYCRFNENSDVYLYVTQEDDDRIVWVCCNCCLREEPDGLFASPEEALAHLREHQAAGHKVPQAALDRLEMEIARGV